MSDSEEKKKKVEARSQKIDELFDRLAKDFTRKQKSASRAEILDFSGFLDPATHMDLPMASKAARGPEHIPKFESFSPQIEENPFELPSDFGEDPENLVPDLNELAATSYLVSATSYNASPSQTYNSVSSTSYKKDIPQASDSLDPTYYAKEMVNPLCQNKDFSIKSSMDDDITYGRTKSVKVSFV